jgi:serine/threonine protein phosphatase 1
MPFIYACSDIHGFLEPLEDILCQIDLSNTDNKLIFCGDYIDYGKNSCKVLYRIKELTEQYPKQVIALMGNHEYMFLEFLSVSDSDIQAIEWLATDKDFLMINSFISSDTKTAISIHINQGGANNYFSVFEKCVPIIKQDIFSNHRDLIEWLKKLPYYYETEDQIFVHAGIDEEAEEFWQWGTPEELFVSKYPATFGKFYKDIIAGHVSAGSLAKDRAFTDIYWDNKSHYFIDGNTNHSGMIPLLKYDTINKRYWCIKVQQGPKSKDGKIITEKEIMSI